MARLGLHTIRWSTLLVPSLVMGAAFLGGACSAAGDDASGFGGSGGSGAGTGTTSTSTDTTTFTTGTGGGGGGSGCSDAAKLIYIIGENNNLYSFHPPTLELKSIGVIDCPQGGFATPFSMAVDRQGVAWVLFNDGHIYHVDVTTAACAATAYQPNQQGWSTFGMGFVSDAPGSEAESLYVAGYFGEGIARIDTEALTLHVVASYDAIGTAAELTGTGDARLYGFFQGSPIIIAEIDKSNGHIISQAPQPSINIGSGWAFAFWGGSFYTFTSPTGNSQIDKYDPAAGTTSTILTNIGDNIVGAGVSTCAPTEPPE
ncbi:MAG: hypothetical protein IT372_07780 [Polyangiaceae bacterium]|nr:hypothetical protein [Polyangiaceae bacterium]